MPIVGMRNCFGDARGEFARHRFEHHGESACRLDGARIALDVPRRVRRFALHVKSAHRVDRLRRQPDVAHHRNFGFHQPVNQFEAPLAALDFHGFRAALFHEAHRVAHRILDRHVEAAVGHVGDEQRVARAAANRAHVMQHFVERDRQRAVVAEHGHADRIAHENDVHAGFIEQARGRIVVCREAGDLVFDSGEPPDGTVLRERMSGTETLPLPACGSILMLPPGAAPKPRDAARQTQQS